MAEYRQYDHEYKVQVNSPSFVFNAINFILSFLLASDGSQRKKRWPPPENHFLSSNGGFLSKVLFGGAVIDVV